LFVHGRLIVGEASPKVVEQCKRPRQVGAPDSIERDQGSGPDNVGSRKWSRTRCRDGGPDSRQGDGGHGCRGKGRYRCRGKYAHKWKRARRLERRLLRGRWLDKLGRGGHIGRGGSGAASAARRTAP